MVEKDKILMPRIHASQETIDQLHLIKELDLAKEGSCFRIQISSKGCEGFRYEFGVSEKLDEDFIVELEPGLFIHMQPFCAFYLQSGILDYGINFETNEDGFKVTNLAQDQFTGKFWKDNEELIPPQKN